MRKKQRIFLPAIVIMTLIIVYAFLCMIESLVIVARDEHSVIIHGDPGLTGKVYRIREGKQLLVVHDTSNDIYESYYLNSRNNVAGCVGGGSTYVPRDFLGFCFVSNWIYDGYPDEGELEAKWAEDGNDIVIIVGGPSENAKELENACDQLLMFQRKITLTNR